jgi:hypothetical protein
LEIENNYLKIDSKQKRLFVLQQQIENEFSKILKVSSKTLNPEQEIQDYVIFSKLQTSIYEYKTDNLKVYGKEQ